MYDIRRITALAASFVLGASALTSCGSGSASPQIIDTPIITVTIVETSPETTVTEAEITTAELTEAEQPAETETEEAVTEETPVTETASDEGYPVVDASYVVYHFRNKKLLNQHFEKHGAEFDGDFDYETAEDYETGASDVINNDEALFKYEKEDGDGVYYIEATNEFVILSKDGYIRTYFRPNNGKKYFDKQ